MRSIYKDKRIRFPHFLAEPGHQQLDHYKAARRRAAQRAQAAPLSVVRPRFARMFPSDPTPHGPTASLV